MNFESDKLLDANIQKYNNREKEKQEAQQKQREAQKQNYQIQYPQKNEVNANANKPFGSAIPRDPRDPREPYKQFQGYSNKKEVMTEEEIILQELDKKKLLELEIIDKKGDVDMKKLKLYIKKRRLEKKEENKDPRNPKDPKDPKDIKDKSLQDIIVKSKERDGFFYYIDNTFRYDTAKEQAERKELEKLYLELMSADEVQKKKNITHFLDILGFLNVKTSIISKKIISVSYRFIVEKILFLLLASCYNATFVLSKVDNLITDKTSTVKQFIRVLFFICELNKHTNSNSNSNSNNRSGDYNPLSSWNAEHGKQSYGREKEYTVQQPVYEDLNLGAKM